MSATETAPVLEFSAPYADQNEADYAALKDAEGAGTLKVESGL